jgi:folate-binding protein YgfZ
MTSTSFYTLPRRGVLEISGEDRLTFLQGLVTQDMNGLATGEARYAALLTPQGKYLFDFLVVADGERLLLDCEAGRAADLLRRLMMYKLRAKVTLTDKSADLCVAACWDGPPPNPTSAVLYRDPRHPDLGHRLILSKADAPAGDATAYDCHRLALGIPDSGDFVVDKLLILEGNLDYLNGVSFTKGCYVGQEITARMKHRGKVRKRLLPVRVSGELPPPGTPVMAGDKVAGELRSGRDDRAMAYLRLEDITVGAAYPCGDVLVTPERPPWLPESALRVEKEEA